MSIIYELETDRLILRQWRGCDYAPFSALNSDPEVMEYFPAALSCMESDALVDKCRNLIQRKGWGFWAVEIKATGDFIGFVGLHEHQADLPFNPCVEIGWRLARCYWGHGYASEAAREALRFAFETLNLERIVSFTAVTNDRSQNVMRRLGMSNLKQNFIHPSTPEGHVLAEHVLYAIDRNDFDPMQ